MLTLRPALIVDIPPLTTMLEDQCDKYYDDYTVFDPLYVVHLVKSGELLSIDHAGYAVGCVWYAEKQDDLHVRLHFLVRPKWLKTCIKQRVFEDAIDYAFDVLGVQKIKARPFEFQKGAIKLLNRYKFKHLGYERNETRKNGKLVDVVPFELHAKYWKRWKGMQCPQV